MSLLFFIWVKTLTLCVIHTLTGILIIFFRPIGQLDTHTIFISELMLTSTHIITVQRNDNKNVTVLKICFSCAGRYTNTYKTKAPNWA